MKVTMIKDYKKKEISKTHLYTDEQLKKEYNYLMAENLTKRMLELELISAAEFDKIMVESRKIFSPFLADIFAKKT